MRSELRYGLGCAFLAAAIRLAFAPFFMHRWDVTTLFDSSFQFINHVNPYNVVVQRTIMLRESSDLSLFYEGYVYLPTMLYIYAPFMGLYKLLYSQAPIINGHRVDLIRIIYPNIFVGLLLLKMPIIISDSVISFLLAVKYGRSGLLYAVNPYSIMITSMWGHFDPLIGGFLLTSFLAFKRYPLISGLTYGLSLTKLYTAVALPVYAYHAMKNGGHFLTKFILGIITAMSPTIYFLITSRESFIECLFCHSDRTVGGMNIYNVVQHNLKDAISMNTIRLIASIIFASMMILTWIILIICRMQLGKSILISMLAFLAFSPLVNEQYVAAILPLSLVVGEVSPVTWIIPIIYVAFHTTYIDLSMPIGWSTIELKHAWDNAMEMWIKYINPYKPMILYFLSIVFSLSLLSSLLKEFKKI